MPGRRPTHRDPYGHRWREGGAVVPVKHRERFQLKRSMRFTVGIWKGQGKVRNELVIAFGYAPIPEFGEMLIRSIPKRIHVCTRGG